MDEKYVVAPGVTIEVSATGDEYRAGDPISPADFPTIAEFKGFLAAGRIVRYEPPSGQPSPRREWDYFSIDERLEADSPNPVSNRALFAAMESAGKGLSSETEERRAADESLSARLDEAEERAALAEATTGSSLASERGARKAADEALSARLDGAETNLAEEAARASRAESNLADSISAEEAARESASAALALAGCASADVHGDGGAACDAGEHLGALQERQDADERAAGRIGDGIRAIAGIVEGGEGTDAEFERVLAEIRRRGGEDAGGAFSGEGAGGGADGGASGEPRSAGFSSRGGGKRCSPTARRTRTSGSTRI